MKNIRLRNFSWAQSLLCIHVLRNAGMAAIEIIEWGSLYLSIYRFGQWILPKQNHFLHLGNTRKSHSLGESYILSNIEPKKKRATKKSSAQKSQKFIASQNINKIGFHRRMLLRYPRFMYVKAKNKYARNLISFAFFFCSHLVCWAKKEQVPIKHANWIYRKQMSILVIKQCFKFFFSFYFRLLSRLDLWMRPLGKKEREKGKRPRIKCMPSANICLNIYTLSDHFCRVFNHSFDWAIFYSISNQWTKQQTQKFHKTKPWLPHKTIRTTKLPECEAEKKNAMK